MENVSHPPGTWLLTVPSQVHSRNDIPDLRHDARTKESECGDIMGDVSWGLSPSDNEFLPLSLVMPFTISSIATSCSASDLKLQADWEAITSRIAVLVQELPEDTELESQEQTVWMRRWSALMVRCSYRLVGCLNTSCVRMKRRRRFLLRRSVVWVSSSSAMCRRWRNNSTFGRLAFDLRLWQTQLCKRCRRR
jgi:hypothetical protein